MLQSWDFLRQMASALCHPDTSDARASLYAQLAVEVRFRVPALYAKVSDVT